MYNNFYFPRKYAILYTYNMWAWLEQNPKKGKKDYFKTHPQNIVKIGCAVCRYGTMCSLGCNDCPMKDKWPTTQGGTTIHCEDMNSCYNRWNYNEDRARNAGDIAAALWRLYLKA